MADNERASFGFYPQLRRNRTVQDPEAAKNAPLAALRGFVSGVAGAPGDLESLAYIPYDYLRAPKMSELVTGEKKTKTFFPTSEEIEKRIPFRGESPVEKAFAGAGQLAGGFYYGAGSPLRVLAESPQILKKAGTDFARSIAPVNVIKPTGGNWVVEPKMDNLYSRAGYKPNLQETLAELQARYTPDVMANLDPNVRDHVSRSIKETTDAVAMDKWLDSNMKNYIKNEMGTVDDPIRLLIEKRETEILGKFEKDQERAQRMASRAEAEPDPRRKANMTRQANLMFEQAEADKALALQHKSHLPPDLQNPESIWTPEELASTRKREGFPEEEIGKTKSSQLWEQMADESIYPTKARDIQEYPARMENRANASAKLADYEAKLDAKLFDKFKEAGIDEGVIRKYLANSLVTHKADAIGEADIAQKLFDKVGPLPSNQQFLEQASTQNPWLAKVDPKSSVYSGEISGLNFDHIVDVIKEDLAAGRLKPEKLNTLSIEQAVRRTADYDLDLAKKMNSERASARADLPVYKEYPEGLRWVQLNRPSDFAAESDAMGHSVRGYEPPQGHPDWVEGSGDSGYSGYGLGGWDAIKSGKAKVYSLVDSKGEPHATIEVGKKQKTPSLKEIEEFYSAAEAEAKNLPQGYTDSDVYDIATRMVRENSPEFIKQIKGKGNARPVGRYDQYTQDFVKSRNWSDVGDLENTGLIKIYPESELYQSLTKMGMDAPSYATQDEITKLLKQAQVGSYRDASKGKTWINDDHPDYRPDPPPEVPPEGMKRGGAVTLQDLAMNYYVPDYNEDDYYEMPMALMPPQQRMSKGGLTQYKECNCHG
jgi:hypothetical protein